jgi:hypothetical protein
VDDLCSASGGPVSAEASAARCSGLADWPNSEMTRPPPDCSRRGLDAVSPLGRSGMWLRTPVTLRVSSGYEPGELLSLSSAVFLSGAAPWFGVARTPCAYVLARGSRFPGRSWCVSVAPFEGRVSPSSARSRARSRERSSTEIRARRAIAALAIPTPRRGFSEFATTQQELQARSSRFFGLTKSRPRSDPTSRLRGRGNVARFGLRLIPSVLFRHARVVQQHRFAPLQQP